MARPDMDISRVVRTLLAHQGRSRAELAQFLDIHVSAVNKSLALKPLRDWSAYEVGAMAAFFNLPVSVFYEDPDNLLRNTRFLASLVSA